MRVEDIANWINFFLSGRISIIIKVSDIHSYSKRKEVLGIITNRIKSLELNIDRGILENLDLKKGCYS